MKRKKENDLIRRFQEISYASVRLCVKQNEMIVQEPLQVLRGSWHILRSLPTGGRDGAMALFVR